MPKKIKKSKEFEFKGNKKTTLNVNNIHYFFLGILVLLLCCCTIAGVYTYSKDKYHVHAGNAIKSFEYSEKVDQGYDSYSVKDMEDKKIYATYYSDLNTEQKRWSRNKFLDFNEEIYSSGILDFETQDKEQGRNSDWSLEIELADGTKKYYSSNSDTKIDKTELANIIRKYFDKEIIYK